MTIRDHLDNTRSWEKGDHCRIENSPGVAFWYARSCDVFADEDETDCLHGDCSIVVMVGDDVGHHKQTDELIGIDTDEFCGGCGQIGCGHGA